MWWRRIAAWLRCVAIRQASNVGWSSGGTRWAITSTSSPWCSRERLPVERRPARHVDELGGPIGHRLGAELADEPDEAGDQPGELGELGGIAAVPAEPHVRVGAVELGEVRRDPAVGHRRAGRVGLLERPLHPSVEHRLVPRRQLLARRTVAAAWRGDRSRPAVPRRSARRGRTTARWTGGGRASRRLRAPGARPPCGSGGRIPTAAGSPAAGASRARRRRGTARDRRCAPARAGRRARPRRRARHRGGRQRGRRRRDPAASAGRWHPSGTAAHR